MVGLGVRTAAVRNLQIQGTLTNTGNSLDLALNGNGFFQITGAGRQHALYARRLFLDQRERPDRHAGRLSRQPGDDHSDQCD